MSDFGSYSGTKLWELDLPKREFLVESIIRAKDSVILVGNEKSGKSVLMQQLVFSLTSQSPFLDKWEIKRACRVSYIQLEGELGDTQDRYKRMEEALDIDKERLQLLYFAPLELHNMTGTAGMGWLQSQIEEYHEPDVIILDPVYFAFTGSLSDDMVVRKFIGNIRRLKDYFQCAIIMVHHTHKPKWTVKGDLIKEGDEAIFGSKFFKAWADHTLFFIHHQNTGLRSLYCNTQRSGDILRQCDLKMIQPSPLYFEETLVDDKDGEKILSILRECDIVKGMTADEIVKSAKITRSTFYSSIKKLLREKLIEKTVGFRPVYYKVQVSV